MWCCEHAQSVELAPLPATDRLIRHSVSWYAMCWQLNLHRGIKNTCVGVTVSLFILCEVSARVTLLKITSYPFPLGQQTAIHASCLIPSRPSSLLDPSPAFSSCLSPPSPFVSLSMNHTHIVSDGLISWVSLGDFSVFLSPCATLWVEQTHKSKAGVTHNSGWNYQTCRRCTVFKIRDTHTCTYPNKADHLHLQLRLMSSPPANWPRRSSGQLPKSIQLALIFLSDSALEWLSPRLCLTSCAG